MKQRNVWKVMFTLEFELVLEMLSMAVPERE